jgi:hypothetical protein
MNYQVRPDNRISEALQARRSGQVALPTPSGARSTTTGSRTALVPFQAALSRRDVPLREKTLWRMF